MNLRKDHYRETSPPPESTAGRSGRPPPPLPPGENELSTGRRWEWPTPENGRPPPIPESDRVPAPARTGRAAPLDAPPAAPQFSRGAPAPEGRAGSRSPGGSARRRTASGRSERGESPPRSGAPGRRGSASNAPPGPERFLREARRGPPPRGEEGRARDKGRPVPAAARLPPWFGFLRSRNPFLDTPRRRPPARSSHGDRNREIERETPPRCRK